MTVVNEILSKIIFIVMLQKNMAHTHANEIVLIQSPRMGENRCSLDSSRFNE
jgi:hypothetical protein